MLHIIPFMNKNQKKIYILWISNSMCFMFMGLSYSSKLKWPCSKIQREQQKKKRFRHRIDHLLSIVQIIKCHCFWSRCQQSHFMFLLHTQRPIANEPSMIILIMYTTNTINLSVLMCRKPLFSEQISRFTLIKMPTKLIKSDPNSVGNWSSAACNFRII